MFNNYLLTTNYPKYVVIESDDWGSIRTSDKKSLEYLLQKDYMMGNSMYSFDCIETPYDLSKLSDVLNQFKDRSGRSPILTANMVMANPNFNEVSDSDFDTYSFTSIAEEEVLFDGKELIDSWRHYSDQKIFVPQLHCREHIKWWKWLEDCKRNFPDAQDTFQLNMCGVPKACSPSGTSYFSPQYIEDSFTEDNKNEFSRMISDGCDLFKNVFRYTSETVVAPNVFWNDIAEDIWHKHGITGIQGSWVQNIQAHSKLKFRPRRLGDTNSNGQKYLIRNCNFEPRRGVGHKSCIKDIEWAFYFGCPAVICSHRVNYVSSIDSEGADMSLSELSFLLTQILDRWPDVKFISSQDLLKVL